MIKGMGDKASTKETMKKAGVPTIPGSQGLIPNFKTCLTLAKEIGFPIMLKATAGGGGKGMRLVWERKILKALGIVHEQNQKRLLVMMVCIWKNSLKILDI